MKEFRGIFVCTPPQRYFLDPPLNMVRSRFLKQATQFFLQRKSYFQKGLYLFLNHWRRINEYGRRQTQLIEEWESRTSSLIKATVHNLRHCCFRFIFRRHQARFLFFVNRANLFLKHMVCQ